ncbi:MAG: ribonuclease T [Dongiaceae bacterium]
MRLVVGYAWILCLLGFLPAPLAQAGGTAGDFDLYVLSLSWSPEYCAAVPDNQAQCGASQHLGLVVHGLWPQYEAARNGADWPSACRTGSSARVPQGVTDVFPTEGLFRHEWREHGACSGLSPADYLALTGRLRDQVHIPDQLRTVSSDRNLPAAALLQSFTAANPGLPADGVVLDCKGNRLSEIRVCFSKNPDGRFQSCPTEMVADQAKDCPGRIRIRAMH